MSRSSKKFLWLWSLVAVMNTIMSLCIPGYHCCVSLVIFRFLYRLYKYLVRCIGATLWCISLLYSSTRIVSGVDMLRSQACWCDPFRRRAWVLEGQWLWGWGFYGWWGFSRASKILFGDLECSSFRWLFLENSA